MLCRCLLATIGLLASAGLVNAQTPPSPPPPAPAEQATTQDAMEEPQVGDHWTYEIRDEITGDLKSTTTHTITDVSATEISIRFEVLGKPGFGYQTYDRSWDIINNGAWRFAPNDGTGVRMPLAVGKSWTFKSNDSNSTTGVNLKRTGTSKVTAKENITTRAGTFEAYKIETSFEMRNANDPTKKSQAEQQVWYVPAINHWVKRTYVSRADGRVRERGALEMVEYGRR
ncbi:TapB family protein [Bradyrhizobium sp. AZCC 2230]|uniref:TapB family protein n=1 Tax=Bradyrhizobium sp. AZCC 2230 TaxID=3117021 RepID=UPI002FF1AFC3